METTLVVQALRNFVFRNLLEKFLASVFWDFQGVVIIDFLDEEEQ